MSASTGIQKFAVSKNCEGGGGGSYTENQMSNMHNREKGNIDLGV